MHHIGDMFLVVFRQVAPAIRRIQTLTTAPTMRPTAQLCVSISIALQWRHNGLDGVSNYQPHHCLLSRLFGRRSKKTSKLRVTGLCTGNSPGTGEFPSHMASNAENVSIWWRHHGLSAKKPQLQCINYGVTSLLHWAIHIWYLLCSFNTILS